MSRRLWLASAALTLASLAGAPARAETRWSAEALLAEAQAKGITTIDEFLKHLPLPLRENYVFMEQSRSLARATVEQPRAILFGTDARILIAVSSMPSDPLFNVIEVLQQDATTGVWSFRLIDFRSGAPVLTPAPEVCSTCHGHPARPIWEIGRAHV